MQNSENTEFIYVFCIEGSKNQIFVQKISFDKENWYQFKKEDESIEKHQLIKNSSQYNQFLKDINSKVNKDRIGTKNFRFKTFNSANKRTLVAQTYLNKNLKFVFNGVELDDEPSYLSNMNCQTSSYKNLTKNSEIYESSSEHSEEEEDDFSKEFRNFAKKFKKNSTLLNDEPTSNMNILYKDLNRLLKKFGTFKLLNGVDAKEWITKIDVYIKINYPDFDMIVKFFLKFLDKEFHQWFFSLNSIVKGSWPNFKEEFILESERILFLYHELGHSQQKRFLTPKPKKN